MPVRTCSEGGPKSFMNGLLIRKGEGKKIVLHCLCSCEYRARSSNTESGRATMPELNPDQQHLVLELLALKIVVKICLFLMTTVML